MPNEIFLDSSFAIAVTVKSDQYHEAATRWAQTVLAASTPVVTTQAVMLEVGNALSAPRYRAAAVRLLKSLSSDRTVKIVLVTQELYLAAFELFQKRPDKSWGLVDCVSFVVMQERGISDALTADEDFEQAGFNALLRSS